MADIGDPKVLLSAQAAIERLCLFVAGGILLAAIALTLSETVLFPGAIFRSVAAWGHSTSNFRENQALQYSSADIAAAEHAALVQKRQILRSSLETELLAAETAIQQVDRTDAKLRSDFLNATSISIDAKKWPSIVSRQILEHAEFKKAWDRVRAAPVAASEIAGKRDTLSGVHSRIFGDSFSESDIGEAKAVAQWAGKKLEDLKGCAADIDHLQVMLKAAAFEDTNTP